MPAPAAASHDTGPREVNLNCMAFHCESDSGRLRQSPEERDWRPRDARCARVHRPEVT